MMGDDREGFPFEWATEGILPAHPHRYVEYCAAMAAALISRRSESPYELGAECRGFSPPALGGNTRFLVRLSWTEEIAARAGRVVQSEQPGPIVQRAAEDGMEAADDPELLDRAIELGRLLFSQDQHPLTEGRRRQRAGEPFSGVVYAHQRRVPTASVSRAWS